MAFFLCLSLYGVSFGLDELERQVCIASRPNGVRRWRRLGAWRPFWRQGRSYENTRRWDLAVSCAFGVGSCWGRAGAQTPAPCSPSITSVTPTSAFFGDRITIEGTCFGSSRKVTFGGEYVDPVYEWSDQRIVFRLFSLNAGMRDLVVTNEYGL